MSNSDVPSGWIIASIDDVATSSGGSTPSKSDPSYWINGNIPWVSPKDMKTFELRSSEDLVTEKALTRLTKIPENSILMVVRSGILARTLPVAINRIPVTVNQDMRAFIPEKTVEPKFIAWQFIANEREILSECSKDGTTVASIEGPAFSAFPLKIAPAAEQTRIVEKLEELLSDLDAGVAELKAAQRKLAQYRQSLLRAAVEGALTADWRAAHGKPQETGAELLQRILSERRARWEQKQLAKFAKQGKVPPQGWEAKYPEPVAPDLAEMPLLPEGWTWASLDQLVAESSYGTSVKCGYESSGDPVLRIPNVSGGKLDFSEIKFASESLNLGPEDYLALGDVLVIRTNGSIGLVGRAAVVSGALPEPYYFASYLLRLRCVETSYTHRWISAALASHSGRRWIEARAASSAGQHNISLSTLLTMPLPLPPLAEQADALNAADVALESAVQHQRVLDKSLVQAAAQRRNILKAAFAGQLVPQKSCEEPASELLARIRATWSAGGAIERKRGRKTMESA